VPDGVSAGQTIAVLAPDGSRLVKATIPAGLKSGDTFLVRLAIPIRSDVLKSQPVPPPDGEISNQPQFSNALDNWTTPIDQPPPGAISQPIVIEKPIRDPTHPTFVDALDRWLTPVPDTRGVSDNNSVTETVTPLNQERDAPPPTSASIASIAPLQEVGKAIVIQDEIPSSIVSNPTVNPTEPSGVNSQSVPTESEPNGLIALPRSIKQVQHVSGQTVNALIEPAEPKAVETESNAGANNRDFSNISTVSNQKLLLVHVPPNLPAGATMQVEIPGENRTLAAIVPPGAESFHIAYTPRSSNAILPPMAPGPSPSMQAPSPFFSSNTKRSPSPKGHKLLLVRVPPGTTAGTTLHVSVPDEPGRILAAQVPPGNVQEFHVSYEARPKQQYSTIPHANGMLPRMNPNNNISQQQQQHSNGQYYHPNNQQQQQSNGSNYRFPAMAGAAAMGGASMLAYDHFHNTNYGDNNMDQYQQQEEYNTTENNYEDSDMMNGGGDYEMADF
jgi:hypothetical protein